MKAICGANCEECILWQNKTCKGCSLTNACPFGKKCWIADVIEQEGEASFHQFQKELIEEINQLKVEGLPKVEILYPLHGSFVNLEYSLPSGEKCQFLNDNEAYLGTQLENNHQYFGVIGNRDFLLVSTYEENGCNPEILIYKNR